MKRISLVFAILISALRVPAQTNEPIQPTLISQSGNTPATRAGTLRVAVLDSPATNEASVGLADFIEAGLEKQGVETYDRRSLRVLLAERGLSRSGVVDFDTARLAQLPAVEMFIRGDVHSTGTNRFDLTLEAVSAGDSVAVVSLNASGKYPQDWLPSLERLILQMSVRLREKQSGDGRDIHVHPITWIPEASLWFFRGLECYANGDYPQAIIAFRAARIWDRHFRLAWLWESRSYQRAGFSAQARRVLEAGQLADTPLGQSIQRPVLAIVAGQGVTMEEQQEFARLLVNSGKVSVLDPLWIGASAREVDLQLTGEMAARSETHNVWLAVDQVVFLERTRTALSIHEQDALTGNVLLRKETAPTTNSLAELAQQLLRPDKTAGSIVAQSPFSQTAPSRRVTLSVSTGESELARCLERAMRNPSDVRALLAAADACLTWQGDVLENGGKQERGVEWRVREEFLAQAVAAIRKNPQQSDASFWLASALWRQRYTPEYTLWASSASGIPLREQMQPLLELFPQSADAINLAETISENIVHNKRSMPVDARYLQPPFPAELASLTSVQSTNQPPNPAAQLEEFRSLVAQKRFARAGLLFTLLSFENFQMDYAENQEFQTKLLQDQQAHDAFMSGLGAVNNPQQLAETLSSWKPCFHAEHRVDEVLGLCDLVSKFSGVQAERRFLEEQFQRYLEDFGTLEIPEMPEPVHPLVRRLCADADALDASGNTEDADGIYELIFQTPEVPPDTRFTTAYELATRYNQRGDYFRATELLRGLLADDDAAIVRDQAFALLKHIRLFDGGELDFSQCCGVVQPPPAADPAEMDALETLFKERMALTTSFGRPTAESLAKTHQEMNRVEKEMLDQHRAALPAFLARKIKESGPSPESMGLCAQLGSQAGPLLPEIVSGVCQFGNNSTQCNALWALANMGHPAAGALPVVILAQESDDATMVQSAALRTREKLGVAPRQTVPYLASLLYHSDSIVALNAADCLATAAGLSAELRVGLSDDEFVQRIQNWWENTGSWQTWGK